MPEGFELMLFSYKIPEGGSWICRLILGCGHVTAGGAGFGGKVDRRLDRAHRRSDPRPEPLP